MKRQDTENIRRSSILVLALAAMLIAAFTETAAAKSLYAIADMQPDPTLLQAYDIGADGTLAFQAGYGVARHGGGAMGMTINSHGKYLFITYEFSNLIQLVNYKTMAGGGTVTAPGAKNLAGIVYDHDKKLLYCVDRTTTKLYAYNWDSNTLILTPVTGSPFTLAGSYAFGIALDEIYDLLYVANYSKSIMVYRTSDWSLVNTISVSRRAISVAVDYRRGLLYYGAGFAEDPTNFYLSQYDLATGAEAEVQVEPDAGVMGLAVDQATGFVYLTTGRNNMAGGDNLKVYTPSLEQIDVIPLGRRPTGMVIPINDVGYNPLDLSKSIFGNPEYVGIGDTIAYDICFANTGNDFAVTNVSLVDTLPDEVIFVMAEGHGVSGVYDPTTHTYRWSYSSVAPGATACLKLVVQVSKSVLPSTTITNWVTIDSDQTPPTTTSAEISVEDYIGKPLNLSKTIVGNPEYVDIGGTFTYKICFDNKNNDFAVTNVSIVDTLPDEVTFVNADGHGLFGQYDPNTHTYTWSYPSLQSGAAACLKLVVLVKEDTEPNATITDYVIIHNNETPSAMASVDVIAREVIYKPLGLSKDIVWSGGTGECVAVGGTITYNICVDNNDNDKTVNDVSIVDTLPEQVTFISADGDGVFGEYDPDTHTYTWSYSSLSPGAGACLKLVVQVNEGTEINTTITNSVTVTNRETLPTNASTDVVTCEFTPLEADLRIVKVSVVPRKRLTTIMVVVKLPQGVRAGDISAEPLVLNPGGAAATLQHAYASGNKAKVIALFDGAGLLDAVPGYGPVKVTVTGRLKSGQPFYGEATIVLSRLIGPRLR